MKPTQKIEKIYVPVENKEDRIHYRHAEGSCHETGREAEVRSAGDLNHENSGDHRTAAGKVEQPVLKRWSRRSKLRRRIRHGQRGGDRQRASRRLADELAAKNVAEVLLVEHELLDAYTPDGYSVALKQVIEAAKPELVFFRTPIRCAISRRNLRPCWARA